MNRSMTITRTCRLPFETVVDQFQGDAVGLIRMATEAATSMANDMVLTLDSQWAWFDVHERVRAQVGETIRNRTDARVDISWIADAGKRLLPGVDGHLTMFAMSTAYTEIGFTGQFVPPPGLIGSASGALIGRRIAEASVGTLLDQLVAHLEQSGSVPAAADGS